MIVVTGAYGHIGYGIVSTLLSAGESVLAVGRDKTGLDTLASKLQVRAGQLTLLPFNVSNDGLVAAAFGLADSVDERISGWVNNAHSRAPGGLIGQLSRAEAEEGVKALSDVILILGDFAEEIRRRGERASVVNIASMYGVVSPNPSVYLRHPQFHNPPIYGAVKAGLIQFTRYSAVHLAPFGVRVNCVSPGAVPNPQLPGKFLMDLTEQVPVGRIGAPSDVAGAVAYLLSPEASYVVGHNLVVDGGWTSW